MAQIPTEITEIIKIFLSVLQQQQKISAAYLYGSYVKGTATEWSDIDLAIISPDFSVDIFLAFPVGFRHLRVPRNVISARKKVCRYSPVFL